MIDPEQHYHQDRQEHTPLSAPHTATTRPFSPPPPVKTRFSNIGGQIAKAARRLSMTSSSSNNTKVLTTSSEPESPSPLSPNLFHPETTSPDLKKKEQRQFPSPQMSLLSKNKDKANNNNPKSKAKEKLANKIDLFNLKSRNANPSQTNLVASPTTIISPCTLPTTVTNNKPRSNSPPAPPSKDTFWRGKARQSTVIAGDDYQPMVEQQHQQTSLPSEQTAPRVVAGSPAELQGLPLYASTTEVSAGQHHTDDMLDTNDSNKNNKRDALQSTMTQIQTQTKSLPCDRPLSPTPPKYQSKVHALKQQLLQHSQQPHSIGNSSSNNSNNNYNNNNNMYNSNSNSNNNNNRLTGAVVDDDLSKACASNCLEQQERSSVNNNDKSLNASDSSLQMEDMTFDIYDINDQGHSSLGSSRRSSIRSLGPGANTALATAGPTNPLNHALPMMGAPAPTQTTVVTAVSLSSISSLESTLSTISTPKPHRSHNFPYQMSENRPLNALEIQQQQTRHSPEQERLSADLILPSPLSSQSSSGPRKTNIVPTQNISRDTLPIQPAMSTPSSSSASSIPSQHQQQHQQQQRAQGFLTAEVIPSNSAMLNQLLALAPSSNRPRLPSQQEWERGFEELRQKRKEADTDNGVGAHAVILTSSLGRQNSTGSRHSKEASNSSNSGVDGKARRHSMPATPQGQNHEDRERQRGDNFKNPMLLSSSAHLAVNSNHTQNKRRSVYEDRAHQQPPIQRQPILENSSLTHTAIYATRASVELKTTREGDCNASASTRGCSIEQDPMNEIAKDPIDIAFDNMIASLSLPATTRAQLELLPKDRKWTMLQSNEANPTLYQTPQTMPPQFFIEALLEFAGKRKDNKEKKKERSSRELFFLNNNSASKSDDSNNNGNNNNGSFDMCKNKSATSLDQYGGSFSNGNFNSPSSPHFDLPSSFQQHLSSLLSGGDNSGSSARNGKRALEEREQVLKKLRVLIRNGSIRWTGEFIKAGGSLALLEFCSHLQKSEEMKLGHRERLLHQVLQCIRAIVTLEGGIDSLVMEGSVFFGLMRTLAIHSTPILPHSFGVKSKTGFFKGDPKSSGRTNSSVATGACSTSGARSRSSSVPKPISIRFGNSGSSSGLLQPSSGLSLDQTPVFSNAQASVSILAAILAVEPDLRDRILKETVADQNKGNITKNGLSSLPWETSISSDEDFNRGIYNYSEWITHLKEIIKMCGVDIPSTLASTTTASRQSIEATEDTRGLIRNGIGGTGGRESGSFSSKGQGLLALGVGSSGSLLDNMRGRRNSAIIPPTTAEAISSSDYVGIKFEPGEEKEILAYLNTHLRLVSKLIFDMFISAPGLAFAKSIKESQLEEYLERVRSIHIQNQDLSAQIEDLTIQLSMIPCTTRLTASRLSRELPVIPPFKPSVATTSIPMPNHVQTHQHQYPLSDAKYNAREVLRVPLGTPHLNGQFSSSRIDEHKNSNTSIGEKPMYGGPLARASSQYKPSPLQQLHPSVHALQQQKQQQQHSGVASANAVGRTRKAAVIGSLESYSLNNANYRESTATPPLSPKLGRQTSIKGSLYDDTVAVTPASANSGIGHREVSGRGYNPLPRDGQDGSMERKQQSTPTQAAPTNRRPTVGETMPNSSRVAATATTAASPYSTSFANLSTSRLPIVPPKSKHRPMSMDSHGFSYGAIPHADHTQNVSPRTQMPMPPVTRPSMNPKRSSAPIIVPAIFRDGNKNLKNVSTAVTATALSRSGSGSAFGRTNHNNNGDQMMVKSYSGTDDVDRDQLHRCKSSTSALTADSAVAHIGATSTAAPNRGQDQGQGNNPQRKTDYGVSETSTCSSTTSSGFTTTTSSNSSIFISALSSEIQKHSFLSDTDAASAAAVSLASSPKPPVTTVSATEGKNMSYEDPQSSSSLMTPVNSVNKTITTTIVPRGVHGFRPVDFDNQIQEDVRRMAASSATSLDSMRDRQTSIQRDDKDKNIDNKTKGDKNSGRSTSSIVSKLEIRATDPKVLEAPIVLPEDIPQTRDQYLQNQISSIVLPPLGPLHELRTDLNYSNSSKKAESGLSRGFSVGNGIPTPAAPISNLSMADSRVPKALFWGQAAQPTTTTTPNGEVRGYSRLPQPTDRRRSSVDPSIPPPSLISSSTSALPSDGESRTFDDAKVFART
ncbi:hypothetical protein BCR41DRAFT_392210 [Lobosporangium transversale]|uniref:Formin GTPase-binding domain-containing protein n=1 Tax=Lobosporangium transversale TaxID=64571 RepID=A0A1Y2GZM0_9FUNG|nr:hypothetical protein BCR41DRAFT_392210 [Lobosporangium transversale]ORZ27757.1 hypothetical protein BCR41DRAFT_392210 [Lobosporangium transversale]|eukprot:XP_021885460.1 hypothetical protein BCR41DRAFT_392210 [Lobosporangium transversale]